MKKISLILFFLTFYGGIHAQQNRVIFITFDGLRWQELFGGIDTDLAQNKDYNKDIEAILEKFDAPSLEEKRQKLMPFIWTFVKEKRILLGNRNEGSLVNLTNKLHFSYPGYNEVLTGFADDKNINSNDRILNPNISVLEYLNGLPDYKGQVYAVGSWDNFPWILNTERSKIPVNSGFTHAISKNPTSTEKLIDKFQDETPVRWKGIRFDVFTHNYALETLKTQKPKVLYIAYGETDDFAHEGLYDQYVLSANRTDAMIRELWEYTQSDPFYKGKTTFVLTTDHGRGTGAGWKQHGTEFKGADETWIIVLGDNVRLIDSKGQFYTNQVAATVADVLGQEFQSVNPTGKSIF